MSCYGIVSIYDIIVGPTIIWKYNDNCGIFHIMPYNDGMEHYSVRMCYFNKRIIL